MTEFVPVAIKTLLSEPIADPGLVAMIGDRVYPVEMAQDAVYPSVVYSQMNAVMGGTKDASFVDHWNIIVLVSSEKYLQAHKISRMVGIALNRKKIEVEEVGRIELRQNGQGVEDLPFEEVKKIYTTAVTFKATKTN